MIAVVLAATGFFVYSQFEHEAKTTVDSGLRSRAGELSAVLRQTGSGLVTGPLHLVGASGGFSEVLEPTGEVIASSPGVGTLGLLEPAQVKAASKGPVYLDGGPLPGTEAGVRLLAMPVKTEAGNRIVVVGTSRETTEESFTDLKQLLLLGLPAALILASIAGYGVATAALRRSRRCAPAPRRSRPRRRRSACRSPTPATRWRAWGRP